MIAPPPPAEAPALFETMRLGPGGVAFDDRHRARLTASAAAFGYRFDPAAFDALVAARLDAMPEGSAPVILRVTLAPGGALAASVRPLDVLPNPLRIGPSPVRIRSDDARLRHKSTDRAPYDACLLTARAAGLDDAVLFNERGEATELARFSLFANVGGGLVTPPLACGLLPGVLRAHLLSTGEAREAVLRHDDLRAAQAIFAGNAARGLLRVAWVEDAKL